MQSSSRTTSLYAPALRTAFDQALSFLESLDSRPVSPSIDAAELRRRLRAREHAGSGCDAEVVVRELAEDVQDGLMGSPTGRFFAWVIGGAVPAAVAADWLTVAWDQNAALYACSPAAAIVEEVAGEWLKELLRIPAEASFALVTGGQMANTTCLAAARNGVLSRHGWNVERQGLFGAPAIKVLCSAAAHGSTERASRLLGIGSDHLVRVATEANGTIGGRAFSAALDEHRSSPLIVCLQAGDINTGAFDDFTTLIPLAKQNHAWVHIDGAFGLWATVSDEYCRFVAGVDQADSWAVDGHKWLNVPYDCGYAFVRDAKAHQSAMTYNASYLTYGERTRDQIDWNPEWSRRARGFATYAALRQLGRDGVAEIVERCCRLAKQMVQGIATLERAEVLVEPTLNQGVVRFVSSDSRADEEANDAYTDEVIARIAASGEAFFSGTKFQGRRCMRISVCNWRTSESDVERAIQAIRDALR